MPVIAGLVLALNVACIIHALRKLFRRQEWDRLERLRPHLRITNLREEINAIVSDWVRARSCSSALASWRFWVLNEI